MKLHILSDIHLECERFEPPEISANVVILAGDIGVGTRGIDWAKKHFDIPVLYIPGNHEYHDPSFSIDEHQVAMQQACKGPNVMFMDNKSTIIQGVRFIGTTLWTDLKNFESVLYCDADRIIVNYEVIKNAGGLIHFDRDYAQSLFEQSKAWLQSQLMQPFKRKTVVMTHHAPSQKSIAPQYAGNDWNPCFASDLEELMDDVHLWVHGHTHSSLDYDLNNTRVVCNPRGYPDPMKGIENDEFDGSMLITI